MTYPPIRPLFALILLLAKLTAVSASECVTISDGDVNDPSVWDCGCQPADCDSLVISHAVSLTGAYTFSQVRVHITSTGSLLSDSGCDFSGELWNEGLVLVNRMNLVSGPWNWTNDGTIQGSIIHWEGDTLINNRVLQVTDTLRTAQVSRTFNHGRLAGDFLWTGGLYNYDTLHFNAAQTTNPVSNSGYWRVEGLQVSLGSVSNEAEGILTVDSLLALSYLSNDGTILCEALLQLGSEVTPSADLDYFPSPALITCGSLKNYGHIGGNGDICVTDSTINYETGVIDQSPDICDASLTATSAPFVDLNLGTIAPSVQWCSQTSCATGLLDRDEVPLARSYPVPTDSWVTVELTRTEKVKRFVIHGPASQECEVPSEASSTALRLDLRDLSPGLYMLVAYDATGIAIARARVARSR